MERGASDEVEIAETKPSYNAVRVEHCKFRTSYGGALFCQDPAYLEGFCRFHHRALARGEINENGVINERISDQRRRREINYHGIRIAEVDYLDERA